MELFELKKLTIKLDNEIGADNSIKSTILKKFKINPLIIRLSFNLIWKLLNIKCYKYTKKSYFS